MLNVTCIKNHSIILSVTCHGLRNFPWLIHIPSKPVMNCRNLWVIIFWVRVTHKMLNVNWEKIHSIILSVTCHGLRNFAPAHTHPHELLKPYELLFFEFEFWPTPPHPYMTHPTPPHPFMTPPHPFMTHPTPPLHDPPTLSHPFMTHPTPPHPTPSWPTHPTLPYPTPDHPSWPTPPHPTPSWPTPPHPTPPLVHFWAQRNLFSWAASLCLPVGRQ